MKSWQRLLFYLALNVIVTIVTTLLVLSWWDRGHRSSLPPSGALSPAALIATDPVATVLPLNIPVIEIKSVVGLGDLNNETIQVQRTGTGQVSMKGWQLEDEDGATYTFPDLILNPGASVQVNTRAGADSVVELFWGLKEPVWRPGEQATLYDPQGNPRATYSIP